MKNSSNTINQNEILSQRETDAEVEPIAPDTKPQEKPEIEPDVLPEEEPSIQPGTKPGKRDDDDPFTETEIGDDPNEIGKKTTIMSLVLTTGVKLLGFAESHP